MKAAAGKLLDLGADAVAATRGLRMAASTARTLGSGVPLTLAKSLLGATGYADHPRLGPAAARTGTVLRKLREAAGLTLDEVGKALDLRDPGVLESLETGKIALPFELILRLAAVVGRNDPVGFVMKLTRTSNPGLWESIEALGVGRLLLQSTREREFANIYRADDAARGLSDKDFAAVLAFTQAAFKLALSLHAQTRGRSK